MRTEKSKGREKFEKIGTKRDRSETRSKEGTVVVVEVENNITIFYITIVCVRDDRGVSKKAEN